YLLFAVALALAVLWRNLYCARLCPFGALQELLHALVPWRLAAAPEEDRAARNLRLAFLWLATVAVFVFGIAEAANYEPFSTAFDFQGGRLRWALLGAVLLLALVRHRPWCRHFCPTGTCLQLLGRMRSRNPFD
ncbi:MAG TPA: 4Fe-4S binding protein, partial [Candidatus Methanoperedens sp.]|nr:4Fe-4S binding protein [Candidatus Methanoperedens sp.]